MAASAELSIILKAVDKASGELKKVSGGFGDALQKVSKAAAVTGIAVGAATAVMVKDFADVGEQLAKFRDSTGVSAEAASVFRMKANEMGTDLSSVGQAIKKMQVNLVEFGTNSKSANEALGPLGLTVAELKNLRPEDQFAKIGNAIAAIPDPALRTAEAVKLFGKSGTDLIPIFEKGTMNLAALREEAAKTGQLFTGSMLNSATNLDDALDKLSSSLDGAKTQMAAALAPAITQLVNTMTPLIQQVSAWVAANPELIAQIATWSAAVLGIVAILNPVGIAIAAVVTAIVGIDYWLKTNGLSWDQFGATIRAVWAGVIVDVTNAVGQVQIQMARMAGAPGPVLDQMQQVFDQKMAALKSDQDQAWSDVAAIPGQKLELQKQESIAKIETLKTSLVGTTGQMREGIIAQIDQLYVDYKAKFGETVTATQEAAERSKSVAGEKFGAMANAAILWGSHFIQNLQSGISSKIPSLAGTIAGVAAIMNRIHQSYNPLLPAQTWGEHFLQNLTTGMKTEYPRVEGALSQVAGAFGRFRSQISKMTDTSRDITNLTKLQNQLKAVAAAGAAQVSAKEAQLAALYKKFEDEDRAKRRSDIEERIRGAETIGEKESAEAELRQMNIEDDRQAAIDKIQTEIDGIRAKTDAEVTAKQTEIETLQTTIAQKQEMNRVLLDQLAVQQQAFENKITFMYNKAALDKKLTDAKTAKERQEIEDQLQDLMAKEQLRVVQEGQKNQLDSAQLVYNKEVDYITNLLKRYDELAAAKAKALGAGTVGASKSSSSKSSSGKKAKGGVVNAGEGYIVGEGGPEAFIPDVRGTIIPSTQTNQGSSIQVVITGNTLLDRDAARKIGDLIMQDLRLQRRLI